MSNTIAVNVVLRASAALDHDTVTAIMDAFADLEPVCDDLLDWTVGATLSAGVLDLDLTVLAVDPMAGAQRARELVELVTASVNAAAMRSVSAETIDA